MTENNSSAATIKASMQRIAEVVNAAERKRAEAWLRFARQSMEALRRGR